MAFPKNKLIANRWHAHAWQFKSILRKSKKRTIAKK